jgi:hypothetical protein
MTPAGFDRAFPNLDAKANPRKPKHALRIIILVGLAILAYLPALGLPFIWDDYIQIPLARDYAAQGWTGLWHNADIRTRATYMFLSAWLDQAFGFTPLPFYAVSLLLHAACVLLLYATCVWSEFSESVAFWAACFFAIYEGHNEAVMWLPGSSELLLFLFGMLGWVCWVKWIQRGGRHWYSGAMAGFLLAVASKESAWIFPFLMLLPVLFQRRRLRRVLVGILPFLAIAAAYLVWTWAGRVSQPGYQDLRFSLSSPWPLTILRSFWRLLFVWGILAAVVLIWTGKPEDRRKVWIACLWTILAIVPYGFLVYMPHIPSRATYVASAGLSLLVGAAAARLIESGRRTLLLILCAVVLAANVEILWVKKIGQMRDRAEASELLKQAARQSRGPVYVDCTPFFDTLAEAVLSSVGKQAVFRSRATQERCFVVEYADAAGNLVRVDRRLGTQRHGVFY